MDRIRNAFRVLVMVGVFAFVFGCAEDRMIVEPRPSPGIDPQSAATVRIADVRDARRFVLKPGRVGTPTLESSSVDDKAITERVVAVMRDWSGHAEADVLLPEGRTVKDLVREATGRALREKGYRVASEGGQPKSEVIPLDVEIRQFWSWYLFGMWRATVEFEAEVHLKGDVIKNDGSETVRGYVLLHGFSIRPDSWVNTITKGTENLCEEMKKVIKEPGP